MIIITIRDDYPFIQHILEKYPALTTHTITVMHPFRRGRFQIHGMRVNYTI